MADAQVITMTPRDPDYPHALRESNAVADIAKAIFVGQRYALRLPFKSWEELPSEERLAYLASATRALRGVTSPQLRLAEMIGAQTCCYAQSVEWFALSPSKQIGYLYSARDVVRGYETFLTGKTHPAEVARARRGRQLLQDVWDAQDREVAAALPDVQAAIQQATGDGQ